MYKNQSWESFGFFVGRRIKIVYNREYHTLAIGGDTL